MDLDGTLFDSVWLWDWIDIEFLKIRGREPTDEYRRGLAALGTRGAAEFTIEYYGLTDTPAALSEEWSGLARDAYKHRIKLFDGAAEYLKCLRSRGVRLVAATSLAKELAYSGLDANNAREFFERVFVSDEMGINKNSPEFYLYIAKELGVAPEECVVFDDIELAVSSAETAGMTAVTVRHGQARDAAQKNDGMVVYSFKEAPDIRIE